jgi:membrane protease subunit (stomatin/prohibitin family)
MIIVESGKVVELCAEPGEFTYDSGTEHSFFDGGKLGENFVAFFKQFGDRFTFGGQPGKDQRVYYFNIKEIIGNKYGTPRPVPFRVVDQRAGIDIDVSVKCFGEYSYKISNPMVFYTNICGNVATQYNRSEIDGQLKSEFLTALQPAFARISEMGIRYSAVIAHTQELADAMREELTKQWFEDRGIEIVKVGVSSLAADEEDEKMLKELQKNAAFTDPNLRNANLAGATMTAMNAAANNQQAGPAMAFMGMNMAQMAGANAAGGFAQADAVNAQINQQYQQAAPAPAAAPAADSWTCPSCGKTVSGNFCPECGAKKPEPAGSWTCSCGAVNTGKFCSQCGAKKPEGAKCSKCGWEPSDPNNLPKFCPECGNPF